MLQATSDDGRRQCVVARPHDQRGCRREQHVLEPLRRCHGVRARRVGAVKRNAAPGDADQRTSGASAAERDQRRAGRAVATAASRRSGEDDASTARSDRNASTAPIETGRLVVAVQEEEGRPPARTRGPPRTRARRREGTPRRHYTRPPQMRLACPLAACRDRRRDLRIRRSRHRSPRSSRRASCRSRLRPLRARLRDHRAPAALPRPDDRRGRRQVREPVRGARRTGGGSSGCSGRPRRQAARRRGRLARDRRRGRCSRPGSGDSAASQEPLLDRVADPARAGARRNGERSAAHPQPLRRARRLPAWSMALRLVAIAIGASIGVAADVRRDRDRAGGRDRDRVGGRACTRSAAGRVSGPSRSGATRRRSARSRSSRRSRPACSRCARLLPRVLVGVVATHVPGRRTSGSRRRPRPRSPRCRRRCGWCCSPSRRATSSTAAMTARSRLLRRYIGSDGRHRAGRRARSLDLDAVARCASIYGARYAGATDAVRLMLLAAAVQLIFGWTKSFPVSIGRPGLRTDGPGWSRSPRSSRSSSSSASLYGATGAAGGVFGSSLVLAAFWTVSLVRLRCRHVANGRPLADVRRSRTSREGARSSRGSGRRTSAGPPATRRSSPRWLRAHGQQVEVVDDRRTRRPRPSRYPVRWASRGRCRAASATLRSLALIATRARRADVVYATSMIVRSGAGDARSRAHRSSSR